MLNISCLDELISAAVELRIVSGSVFRHSAIQLSQLAEGCPTPSDGKFRQSAQDWFRRLFETRAPLASFSSISPLICRCDLLGLPARSPFVQYASKKLLTRLVASFLRLGYLRRGG